MQAKKFPQYFAFRRFKKHQKSIIKILTEFFLCISQGRLLWLHTISQVNVYICRSIFKSKVQWGKSVNELSEVLDFSQDFSRKRRRVNNTALCNLADKFKLADRYTAVDAMMRQICCSIFVAGTRTPKIGQKIWNIVQILIIYSTKKRWSHSNFIFLLYSSTY